MSRPASCRRFEALVDRWVQEGEPFDPQEEAFFEEHRRQCRNCALSMRLVEEMQQADSVFDAEHPGSPSLALKARQIVAAADNREIPSPRGWTKPRVAAGRVIATAAAAVLALVLLRPPADVPPAPHPADAPVATLIHLDDVPTPIEPIAIGDTAVHLNDPLQANDSPLFLQLADSSTTYLEKGASASVIAANPEATQLSLEQGRIFLHVMPREPGESFTIDVPGGQVRVIGTIFSVSLARETLEVSVAEGLVRLELTGGSAVEIPAGQVYRTGDGLATLSAGQMDTIDRAARLGVAPSGQLATGQGFAAAGREPSPTHEDGAYEDPPVKAPPSLARADSASGETPPPIPALLQAARESRFEGDWAGAVRAYQDLIAAYPDSPEALTCLVPLGQLQLQQLDQPEEALTSFSQYARAASHGALLEEAEWGIAQSLRELGRVDDEHLTLTVFRDHHPHSVYAAEVEARLKELESQR